MIKLNNINYFSIYFFNYIIVKFTKFSKNENIFIFPSLDNQRNFYKKVRNINLNKN